MSKAYFFEFLKVNCMHNQNILSMIKISIMMSISVRLLHIWQNSSNKTGVCKYLSLILGGGILVFIFSLVGIISVFMPSF